MTIRSKFRALILESIEAQSANLTDDRCEDIGQYRRACGIIYGLKMSLEAFDEAMSSKPDEEEHTA